MIEPQGASTVTFTVNLVREASNADEVTVQSSNAQIPAGMELGTAPIVGAAAHPSGRGYWLVATDGGVFTFGEAGFYGSTGSLKLNQPIVGMASTSGGHGYWLVATDGGIFTFGDAVFKVSTGNVKLNKPVAGMAVL